MNRSINGYSYLYKQIYAHNLFFLISSCISVFFQLPYNSYMRMRIIAMNSAIAIGMNEFRLYTYISTSTSERKPKKT